MFPSSRESENIFAIIFIFIFYFLFYPHRSRVVVEPRVVLKEFGLELPDEVKVQVMVMVVLVVMVMVVVVLVEGAYL